MDVRLSGATEGEEMETLFREIAQLTKDLSLFRVYSVLRQTLPLCRTRIPYKWHVTEDEIAMNMLDLVKRLEQADLALQRIPYAYFRDGDAELSRRTLQALQKQLRDIYNNGNPRDLYVMEILSGNPERDIFMLRSTGYLSGCYVGKNGVLSLAQELRDLKKPQTLEWISKVPHTKIHVTVSGGSGACLPQGSAFEIYWWCVLGSSDIQYTTPTLIGRDPFHHRIVSK